MRFFGYQAAHILVYTRGHCILRSGGTVDFPAPSPPSGWRAETIHMMVIVGWVNLLAPFLALLFVRGYLRRARWRMWLGTFTPTPPRLRAWVATAKQLRSRACGLQNRLLPARHFQLVFTIAHELLPLWRYNQKELGDALFRAARLRILPLLGDRSRVGVCPGFVLSLHTSGEELQLHPYLHGLITAGGLTERGQWEPSAEGYLVWGPALRDAFRDRLLREIHRLLDRNRLTLPPDRDRAGVRSMLEEIGHVQLADRGRRGCGTLPSMNVPFPRRGSSARR